MVSEAGPSPAARFIHRPKEPAANSATPRARRHRKPRGAFSFTSSEEVSPSWASETARAPDARNHVECLASHAIASAREAVVPIVPARSTGPGAVGKPVSGSCRERPAGAGNAGPGAGGAKSSGWENSGANASPQLLQRTLSREFAAAQAGQLMGLSNRPQPPQNSARSRLVKPQEMQTGRSVKIAGPQIARRQV